MNMNTHHARQKNYSIHFGCIDLIHHVHNQYKSSLAYVNCSYEQNPMVIFFQKIIDSMKKLKVLIEVDFGNLGFGLKALRVKIYRTKYNLYFFLKN